MEQTRDLQITVEIFEDTNKATYRAKRAFDSYADAREWLNDAELFYPREEES